MYGYPCARRAFSFFILMLALVLSGTGAAAAELSRPTFDPLREKAPMNNDGFRIIARGDAAVPPLTPREADIILRKATEAPWSGEYEKNTAAGTYAASAAWPCTVLRTSSIPGAAGPPSTMPCRAWCVASPMPTATGWRSFASTAAPTWGMFLRAKA